MAETKMPDRNPLWKFAKLKFLETVGVVAVAVASPLGAFVLGVLHIYQQSFHLDRVWLLLWGGMFCLAVAQAATLHFTNAILLLLLFVLNVGLAAILNTRKRTLTVGFATALVVFFVTATMDIGLSTRLWQAYDGRSNLASLARLFSAQRVDVPSTRSWKIPVDTAELQLTFRAKFGEGVYGWNWHRSEPGIELQPIYKSQSASKDEADDSYAERSEVYVHVEAPEGNHYLKRSYLPDVDIGSTPFRARITLRSDDVRAETANVALVLQTFSDEKIVSDFVVVQLHKEWQTTTFDWTPPASISSDVIELVLTNLNDIELDIREANVYRYSAAQGSWLPLDAPAPTGFDITVSWPGKPSNLRTSLRSLPPTDWQPFELSVEHDSLHSAEQVDVTLWPESGLAVDLAETSLTLRGPDTSVVTARPELNKTRTQIWFGHPNLAGHVIATTGLVLVMTTTHGWYGTVFALVTLGSIYLTGSRAALLAAVVGFVWLLWLTFPKKRDMYIAVTVLAAALFTYIIGIGGLESLRLGSIDGSISRVEIWQIAWHGVLEYPWSGVGTDFSTYWQRAYQGNNAEAITHAHNLWLQFAAAYGLPGFFAILWLTGGLLFLAWRWGRWRGLALVTPIFIMNLFDYTFFYSGVLFPLILGMNVLRSNSERKAGAGEASASTDKTASIDT